MTVLFQGTVNCVHSVQRSPYLASTVACLCVCQFVTDLLVAHVAGKAQAEGVEQDIWA
jgi:hypothetical protein